MKRLLSLILTACLLLCLAGCGSSGSASATAAPAEQTVQVPEPVPSEEPAAEEPKEPEAAVTGQPETAPADVALEAPEEVPDEPVYRKDEITYDPFTNKLLFEDGRVSVRAYDLSDGISLRGDILGMPSEESIAWLESRLGEGAVEAGPEANPVGGPEVFLLQFYVQNNSADVIPIERGSAKLAVNGVTLDDDAWVLNAWGNVKAFEVSFSCVNPGKTAECFLCIDLTSEKLKELTGKPYLETLSLSESIMEGVENFFSDLTVSHPLTEEEKAYIREADLQSTLEWLSYRGVKPSSFPKEMQSEISACLSDPESMISVGNASMDPDALQKQNEYGEFLFLNMDVTLNGENASYHVRYVNLSVNGHTVRTGDGVITHGNVFFPGRAPQTALTIYPEELPSFTFDSPEEVTSVTADLVITPTYYDEKKQALVDCTESAVMRDVVLYSK